MEEGSGAEGSVGLLNDFQTISFGMIALILVGTWLAAALVRRALSFLAERGPVRPGCASHS